MIYCHWSPAEKVTSHQSYLWEWRMVQILWQQTSPSSTATPTAPAPPACRPCSRATGAWTDTDVRTTRRRIVVTTSSWRASTASVPASAPGPPSVLAWRPRPAGQRRSSSVAASRGPSGSRWIILLSSSYRQGKTNSIYWNQSYARTVRQHHKRSTVLKIGNTPQYVTIVPKLLCG